MSDHLGKDMRKVKEEVKEEKEIKGSFEDVLSWLLIEPCFSSSSWWSGHSAAQDLCKLIYR